MFVYLTDTTTYGWVGHPDPAEVVGAVGHVEDGVHLGTGIGAEDQALSAHRYKCKMQGCQ